MRLYRFERSKARKSTFMLNPMQSRCLRTQYTPTLHKLSLVVHRNIILQNGLTKSAISNRYAQYICLFICRQPFYLFHSRQIILSSHAVRRLKHTTTATLHKTSILSIQYSSILLSVPKTNTKDV